MNSINNWMTLLTGLENKVMAKIKLDLHDIFSNGRAIEVELNRVIQEAVSK